MATDVTKQIRRATRRSAEEKIRVRSKRIPRFPNSA